MKGGGLQAFNENTDIAAGARKRVVVTESMIEKAINEISAPTCSLMSAVIGLEDCAKSALEVAADLRYLALTNSVGKASVEVLGQVKNASKKAVKELEDVSKV